MAFFSGIYNFGIGFGAFLGGRVVDSVGIEYVFSAGGVLGIVGLLFCIFIASKQVKKFPVRL